MYHIQSNGTALQKLRRHSSLTYNFLLYNYEPFEPRELSNIASESSNTRRRNKYIASRHNERSSATLGPAPPRFKSGYLPKLKLPHERLHVSTRFSHPGESKVPELRTSDDANPDSGPPSGWTPFYRPLLSVRRISLLGRKMKNKLSAGRAKDRKCGLWRSLEAKMVEG